MRPFAYLAPNTWQAVWDALQNHTGRVKILAGGTHLIPQLQSGQLRPSLLLDLRLLSLGQVVLEEDGWVLGACVTHAALIRSKPLRDTYPALIQACRLIGGVQVRNRGTIGGNLMRAQSSSSLLAPLLAHDAHLRFASPGKQRDLPISEFMLAPGETCAEAQEILIQIRLPLPPADTCTAYVEVGKRQAMVAPVAACCAVLSFQGDRVARAHLALGALSPRPLHAVSSERYLIGKPLTTTSMKQAAALAEHGFEPLEDLQASRWYRQKLAPVVVLRALEQVAMRRKVQGMPDA